MNVVGTVALIRRNLADSPFLIAWLRKAGVPTVDVCDWSDVQLLRLSSDGFRELRLAGTPLERIDAVMMTGTPGVGEDSSLPIRDRWYGNAERTSALQAALAGAQCTYIINRGEALLLGRQLADPLTMLRRLALCGWRTPTLRSGYTIRDDDFSQSRALSPPDWSSSTPGEIGEKQLVIFTRCGDPFTAGSPAHALPADVFAMKEPMYSLLHSLDLDWATVAIGKVDGRIHAFGMRPWLPISLGAEGFARALHTIKTFRKRPSVGET